MKVDIAQQCDDHAQSQGWAVCLLNPIKKQRHSTQPFEVGHSIFKMRYFILFCWTSTLLTIHANPLPSDSFYSDFYEPDSGVQGDSIFGDIASIDSSTEGFNWDESSPQDTFDTGSLWPSDDRTYDTFSPDDGQDLMISEDSDLLMSSSCGGAEVQKRDQLRIRDDGSCPSSDQPVNFKVPTINPPTLPKTPAQSEIKPTLGRLRFGPPRGNQDPICSVEPYDHHLCCDGPIGGPAMYFGDLEVYTPVKNCRLGKVEF